MTGVRLELIGADEALAVLGRAVERASRPRGLWDAVGAALVASTQRRFELGEGPDGNPWPLSIRAIATGGQTLIDTGRLMRSITHEASDSGVAVGTNVIYGAVHQFGGTIRPVVARALRFMVGGREVFAREATIPARPFLGLDRDDAAGIEAVAGDWLLAEQAEDGGSRAG